MGFGAGWEAQLSHSISRAALTPSPCLSLGADAEFRHHLRLLENQWQDHEVVTYVVSILSFPVCPVSPVSPISLTPSSPYAALTRTFPNHSLEAPILSALERTCVAPNFLENSPALDQQENACSRQTPLPLLVLPKGLLFPAKFQVDTELEYLSNSSQ